MSIEAMKQAIEALKGYRLETNEAAIKALEQAIEQADHIPNTTKMMPTGKDSLQVEAMKHALDALALFASDESDEGQVAIAAHEELRQAIQQAEKEQAEMKDWEAVAADQAMTIAMMKTDCYGDGNVYRGVRLEDSETKTIWYKREWVGLTDEEILNLYTGITKGAWDCIMYARVIEGTLKEANK